MFDVLVASQAEKVNSTIYSIIDCQLHWLWSIHHLSDSNCLCNLIIQVCKSDRLSQACIGKGN